MRKNITHDIVVESISEALLRLMNKKDITKITIKELCDVAGVSRISFYRNFDSKEQIIVKYLNKLTDDWWFTFSKKAVSELYKTFWIELLTLYKNNEELIKLIYRNNISYLLKEHVFECCAIGQSTDEVESYHRAALAGALYGLIDEWIKRGMNNFPKDFSLHEIINIMP